MGHDELGGVWDEDGGEEAGTDAEVGEAGEEAGGDGAVAPLVHRAAVAAVRSSRSTSFGTDREAVRRAAEVARACVVERAGIPLDLWSELLPGSPSFVTEVEGVGKLLLSTRNATGYQGVSMPRDKNHPARLNKYVALLNCGGVTKHIGCLSTALEAAICYSKRKHVLDAKSAHLHKRPRPCSASALAARAAGADTAGGGARIAGRHALPRRRRERGRRLC
jgi:hypothetical protein